MTLITRAFIAQTGIALLSAGALSLALASPASAVANTAASSPSATPAAESAASNAVAAFASTHPLPIVNSTDPATYAAQTATALAYWRAAPVAEMVAQYGCTESGLSIGESATSDGVEHVQISAAISCANSAATPVVPLTTMTSPRFATATTMTANLVHPDATYGGCSTHSAYCIYGYYPSGELEEYYQYQGTSSFTGHVRDGRGANCGPGTFLANSSNEVLGEGGYIDFINYDYTVDSTYSDENVTSGGSVGGIFCKTF
jgi:hypothetical protein